MVGLHRAAYRGGCSASTAARPGIVTGCNGFDAEARLRVLARNPLPNKPLSSAVRVLHISLYCFKSFPIRIFHALSLKDGVDSHAIFFKNNFTNDHLPVTETELALLRERVRTIDPHLITLSVMAPYVVAARQVIAEIRNVSSATIIVGGKYPTISPTDAVGIADYACKGEGELPLLRVFERLRRGQCDLRGIKGLWYRDDDGVVVDMGQETLYQELDHIPYPAISECQMNFIELNRVSERDPEIDDEEMLMMAGRGCVYLCSFCVNSVLIPMNRGNGRFVRLRSPEHVIEEINYRRAKCAKAIRISFNDEVFGVFDDWVADFAAKYKGHCRLPFECELVPKLIKEHNIQLLADAGLFSLHFGIQSGHDEVRRDIMNRPGNNKELLEKAAVLEKYGVERQFDIILGNPFDTVETFEMALDLLLAMPRPMSLNTYKMQYFPHYPFTMMAIEAGYISSEDVSYEKVAESTLYNFIYRPKFPALSRRDYLENCIYIMPWDSSTIRWLVATLRRHHNVLLGFIVSLLAIVRYNTDFEQRPALIWLRRVVLGVRLLARGDFNSLVRKTIRAITTPIPFRPRTGRLSSR